jgi:glycosyltransferase involved in cell wall biosynthesis
MSLLKVSLVCPTHNRYKYLPIALRCFTQQRYLNVELIIVDDSTETASWLLPQDDRIRLVRLSGRMPTGTKRNIGAEQAKGDIIANWDDDDWSSPHRIEDQVQRLVTTGKGVTGYNATVVYDETTGKFYRNNGGPPYYASGTSQCYLKSWWRQHPYPECSYGEDSVFARAARLADQCAIVDPGRMMVARKHANNTDIVHLERLMYYPPENVSLEFFQAQINPRPEIEYMYAPHICTQECEVDSLAQMRRLVVDYKVKWLPLVKTR